MALEPKLLFALCATAIGIVSYVIYIRDVLRGRTQPHLYTWLIWSMTTGTFAAAIFAGGGGRGFLAPLAFFLLTCSTTLLSLKFGTKNVTRGDALSLAAALIAILIWWQLNSPLLALIVATATDLVGYLPTVRKSYEEPWSESLASWSVWTFAIAFTVLALDAYNPLTLLSSVATAAANILLLVLLLLRRRVIPNPGVRSAVG
jgi:hypothetical protein